MVGRYRTRVGGLETKTLSLDELHNRLDIFQTLKS